MNKVFISYSYKDKDWVKNYLLKKAEKLVEETGYHRRDRELEELRG